MNQVVVPKILSELAKLRHYYALKNRWSIGPFWRRKKRSQLKNTVKSQAIAAIILSDDGILYPTQSQDHVTNGALYRGDAIKEIRWVIEKFARPGSLCLDIGTNIGYIAAFMAKCVGAQGQVWCFEPNPKLAQSIRDIFWLNGWQHYQLQQVALANQGGEVGFEENSADHSTSKINQRQNPPHGSLTVPCKRLDDYLEAIKTDDLSLVKIDVEGYELPVLQGGAAFFKRFRPAVIFETGLHDTATATALAQCLANYNYRLAGIIQPWGLVPCEDLPSLNQHQRHVNVLALPNY